MAVFQFRYRGGRHQSRVPELDGHMNPFGIFQAAIASLEAAIHAGDPKRQKKTKGERRRFLVFYFTFISVGIAVVVWTIHSLYFAK